MLILIAVVSVVLAWLSSAAKQYRDEQEIVKQLDVISSGCEWQPGGSSWLRKWIGDDYFRIFDRVVQVELGHKQHFARWLRDAETTGVLSANDVPDYPAVPRIEGTGSVMTDRDHALPGLSLPDDRDEAQRQRSDSEILAALDADLVSLGRLTNLRGLILDKTGITDKEMARLAGLTKLQSLELRERRIGDEGLAYLADLTNLERLSLSGTGVTDDGLVHLKKLNKLKNLSLGRAHITDAGLVHLERLANLRFVFLRNTRVTKQGVARLRSALGNRRVVDGP